MNQIKKEENPQNTKKSGFKFLIHIGVFFLLIYLTYRVILKDQNMEELYHTVHSSHKFFIILGMLCMVSFYLFESINIRRTLRALGEKCSLGSAFKYTLIGIFFSGITPAASGGQPMQVIYMRKDGIKVASSSTALLLNLFSFQIVTIGMALLSALCLQKQMTIGMWIFLAVGILLNGVSLFLITIGMFSPKLSTVLVSFVAKVMKWLKVKDYDQKEEKMRTSLVNYHESAQYIRNNKKVLLKQFIVAILEQISYYSVPFFVILSLGLPVPNYFVIIGLQSLVFAMASGIPLPGAVGVSEGAFISIYQSIFTEKMISTGMILHRGISFYLPMIVCAIVVMVSTFYSSKNKEEKD